jgi:hypothetical protein
MTIYQSLMSFEPFENDKMKNEFCYMFSLKYTGVAKIHERLFLVRLILIE